MCKQPFKDSWGGCTIASWTPLPVNQIVLNYNQPKPTTRPFRNCRKITKAFFNNQHILIFFPTKGTQKQFVDLLICHWPTSDHHPMATDFRPPISEPAKMILIPGRDCQPSGDVDLIPGENCLIPGGIVLPSGEDWKWPGDVILPSGGVALPSGEYFLPSGDVVLLSGEEI